MRSSGGPCHVDYNGAKSGRKANSFSMFQKKGAIRPFPFLIYVLALSTTTVVPHTAI